MIRAADLVKTYRDGLAVPALRGVSLEVAAGELVGIAGPSGSGKTTFLNLVGGLDAPTSGEVDVDGQRLDLLPPRALARLRRAKLGFVFQSYNLIPVLTALENVELSLLVRGTPPAGRREEAAAMLARVGLEGLESRRPAELSGGQQQRVAVARAVVGAPRLVVADEPTANLDSETAAEIVELFARLNRELGVTFLLSSHDPEVLSRMRRVVRFHDGRVASDGPPAS